MKVRIEKQGFEELGELFKQLPPKITNRALAVGTLAGARVIAKAAKSNAPRDEAISKLNLKYGTLRQSIKAKGLRKKYENVRAAVVTRGGAFWGDIINRGSRYIPATRWFDRAYDSSSASAQSTITKYILAKIQQEANRLINRLGL